MTETSPGLSERVDVDLVARGWLRALDGRVRHVPGLDLLARQALVMGVSVSWLEPPDGKAAWALLWDREIWLAPWLFDCDPFWVRDVWSHELMHLLVGESCARAREAQRVIYGELLAPLEVAV